MTGETTGQSSTLRAGMSYTKGVVKSSEKPRHRLTRGDPRSDKRQNTREVVTAPKQTGALAGDGSLTSVTHEQSRPRKQGPEGPAKSASWADASTLTDDAPNQRSKDHSQPGWRKQTDSLLLRNAVLSNWAWSELHACTTSPAGLVETASHNDAVFRNLKPKPQPPCTPRLRPTD